MFNKNRGLFPSYSGAEDVNVQLPSAPSRASVSRDISDLWETHTQNPHVVANDTAGISVPYPDDGFDPQSLSETSHENTLVNRAKKPSSNTFHREFLQKLNATFLDMALSQMSLSNMSILELKAFIERDCPGALLVYNGSNQNSLLKAYALIKSFESTIESLVSNSKSPIDTKENILDIIGDCEPIREALLIPDSTIRQRLLGSTKSVDHLDDVLETFNLKPEDDVIEDFTKLVDTKDEFIDYKREIARASLELDILIQSEIALGRVDSIAKNVLRNIQPELKSIDIYRTFELCIHHCKSLALSKLQSSSQKLLSMIEASIEELEEFGISSAQLSTIKHKMQTLEKYQELTISNSHIVNAQKKPIRAVDALQKAIHTLQNAQSQIQAVLHQIPQPRKAFVLIELYIILCLLDCCNSILNGDNQIHACSANLYKAICEELMDSNVQDISKAKKALETAKLDLQSTQKSTILKKLESAKDGNKISEKKLQTLTSLLG